MILRGFLVLLWMGPSLALVIESYLESSVQDCYNQNCNNDTSTFVGKTCSWYCENSLLPPKSKIIPVMTDSEKSFIKSLEGSSSTAKKRQTTTPCERKEIRMLTDTERNRLFGCIQTLKSQQLSSNNNAFDVIADMHIPAQKIAHGGCGFLGWHRVYLRLYERALKQINPLCCLCYWDTTLDQPLPNPWQSPLFTPLFVGNARSNVSEGPFKNWYIPSLKEYLNRAAGQIGGQLISASWVANLLTVTSYSSICGPSSPSNTNIESSHGNTHIYVGGHMSYLATSSRDPLFFFFHCYIDYLFQKCRNKMRSLGKNPDIYPANPGPAEHAANYDTGLKDDNGNVITQAQAYSSIYEADMTYTDSPTCSNASPTCNSRYLTCSSTRKCTPNNNQPLTTAKTIETQFALASADTTATTTATTVCPSVEPLGAPVINNYCVDGICGVENWVLLPIEIICLRPSTYHYDSYPVRNGYRDNSSDIYSGSDDDQLTKYITYQKGKPKTYDRCTKDDNVAEVYVTSRGLSYDGTSKVTVIIDHRHAVTHTISYIEVKKPSDGKIVRVLIRAEDDCGRVCGAVCKYSSTGQYKPCKGAIYVTSEQPLMYGNTYGEAVKYVFGFDNNYNIPQYKSDIIFLGFYCDFNKKFPYADPVV